MSDRFFNRDRNRPYEDDFDDDYYNENYGSRGYDRTFDENRGYGMRSRGSYGGYGYGRNYGRVGYGYNPGYRSDYNRGYGYNQGMSGSYGYPGSRGYDYDFDYDNEYGQDYDRWGSGHANRFDYDRGRYGRGDYGRPYSGYGGYRGPGSNDYGSGYGRGFGQNRYGQRAGYEYNRGTSGFGYDRDFDSVSDYDYDFDNEPVSWTYQEIWLIPGPFSGIGPENYRRSDDRIREDINERLTQHGRLNARNVQVEVNNGEVTLNGSVDRRQDKRTAEDIAVSVSGVQDVHNQIKVQDHQRFQDKEQQKRDQPSQNRERSGSTSQRT